MEKYDFSGWATRVNLKCSDGRTILKDAFKHNDGQTVPLVWNHQHNDPLNVLGHALLENREEGVYSYCKFNDTESGQTAKKLVKNGDISALSIYANQLKQQGGNVTHGAIREVSLVLAGANPGAFIDSIISHGEESEEEGIIYTGENIELYHADGDETVTETDNTVTEESTETTETTVEEPTETVEESTEPVTETDNATESPADDNNKNAELQHTDVTEEPKKGKTIKELWDTLDDEQKDLVSALVALATEDENKKEEVENKGETEMKQNVFEKDNETNTLTHADQEAVIKLAKASNVGSFQMALGMYAEENKLQHGFVDGEGNDAIGQLFPDYKDVKPGAPELIERDQTWVGEVMRKTHKSPISRIRTRQVDARGADVRAKGYKKGAEKTISGNLKLMGRTTDPQTVYRKDFLHRDDIIDITDFDVVNYKYGVMKSNLYEDIALATMVGDLREDGDADKISEEHIRPIWKDDELYTIHYDIDIAAARQELQGSNTSANFGENYIYAEALVTASLYSREQYKGSGNLEFYCTPHLLNVMLLARDLNGRRIYDSKADLAKALNVSAIHTAEQFEGLTRTDKEGKKHKLLGLFVNLNDYQHGSTKGGEITRFEQFDIDFNQNKYLIETRLSGALTKIKSAIALEEPIAD